MTKLEKKKDIVNFFEKNCLHREYCNSCVFFDECDEFSEKYNISVGICDIILKNYK